MVDGNVTQGQRLMVSGAKIAFLLFWLLVVFAGLNLASSKPAVGLFLSSAFFRAVVMTRKGAKTRCAN
jgi:hypothetical protein